MQVRLLKRPRAYLPVARQSLPQTCLAGQWGSARPWRSNRSAWESPRLQKIFIAGMQRFAPWRHYPAYWLDRPRMLRAKPASSAVRLGCRKDGGERPWESRVPHDSRSSAFLRPHSQVFLRSLRTNRIRVLSGASTLKPINWHVSGPVPGPSLRRRASCMGWANWPALVFMLHMQHKYVVMATWRQGHGSHPRCHLS